MTADVKGFRMPAGRRRAGMHGGRRPKSLEGGKRGVFCAGGGDSLWGFNARLRGACWFSDRDAGRVSGARVISVGLGAVGRAVSRCGICVFAREGGAGGCRRLSVGVTGEISASDRRSGRGRRQERVGHELSRLIDGRGHRRGWQPGSKVSMMIIRPPQQGQAFQSWSMRRFSAALGSRLDGAGPGALRSRRANAILFARLALAKRP